MENKASVKKRALLFLIVGIVIIFSPFFLNRIPADQNDIGLALSLFGIAILLVSSGFFLIVKGILMYRRAALAHGEFIEFPEPKKFSVVRVLKYVLLFIILISVVIAFKLIVL